MGGNISNNWFRGKTDRIFVQLFRYFFSGGIAFLIDKALFALCGYCLDFNVYVGIVIGFVLDFRQTTFG